MRTLLLTLTTCLLVLPVQAKYSGGSGTADDPYQIATADDLILLGETPGDYDNRFVLTADIDLDPNLPGRKVFDKAVIAPDTNDVAYKFQGTPFTGVFDGDGHRISHLTVTGKDYLGLFGWLKSGAVVKDLGVVDVDVIASGNYAGGLAGSNGSSFGIRGGSVTNCYSTGSVSGHNIVGGAVGDSYEGTVTWCYSAAAVSGEGFVGGLVGYNYGTVTDCYCTGTVSGGVNVGGLVGYNSAGDLTQCYSTGAVSGTGRSVGGLVGYNQGGTLTRCYATGAVNGTECVGGLVGYILDGPVTHCYSTGAVSGGVNVGGLVGENGCTVTQCYSTGAVSGKDNVGGLVGSGSATACFWDIQTSSRATSGGGTGLTTAQMQDPNTFMVAGWDFVGQADGPHDIWAEPAGGGYPLLCWQLPNGFGLPDFSRGTGEVDAPYRISTPPELNAIGHNPRLMRAHFELVNDIDLTGIDFYIMGDEVCPFTGSFNGNGYTVSHLTITGEDHLGLFGVTYGGLVTNLGIVDVNIVGSGVSVGGLVGNNCGTVTDCYCTGTVSGKWYVGGLVGWNDGAVTECYSTGAVSGNGYVGGLVGANSYGSVTQCYSAGAVSSGDYVGGLVGYGASSHVTACFWNTQTSGQTTSAGGTGKTTAEMQMAKTFLDAGWDFVGETANGTADLWWILEGKDYPRLWWEAAKK